MIQKLVRNPVYKGQWIYGRTRRAKVDGKVRNVPTPEDQWIYVDVDAIITPERWELAQRRLAENRALSRRNQKREYLLSGLVVCACGYRRTGKVDRRSGHGYYVCQGASERKTPWLTSCDIPSIRQDRIEAAVWHHVIDELSHPDCMRADVQRRCEEAGVEAERRQRRIASGTAELASIDQRLGALLLKELDDYPAQVIDQQKRALLTARKEADAKLTELRAEQVRQDFTPDMLSMLEEFRTGADGCTEYDV